MIPFPTMNLPFFNYIQDLTRTNNTEMGKYLSDLQKDFFSAAPEPKRMPPPMPIPPPLFSQTVHHHHHPYFSQILLNNSFLNHFPSSDSPTFPFHYPTPKKRRTKVDHSHAVFPMGLSSSI